MPAPNVRVIRTSLGMSQDTFAHTFGFSVNAVRDWEQGRRLPEIATRNYLLVIQHNPQAVREALVVGVKLVREGRPDRQAGGDL